MKKMVFQFAAGAAGAAAGAVAFALYWKHIDRFFYDAFGIVLQCDGCHGPSLSLLYIFIPCTAAFFAAVFSAAVYRANIFSCLLSALLASVCIGGTLSLLAVQFAAGPAAAILVACSAGAAAAAGCWCADAVRSKAQRPAEH